MFSTENPQILRLFVYTTLYIVDNSVGRLAKLWITFPHLSTFSVFVYTNLYKKITKKGCFAAKISQKTPNIDKTEKMWYYI